MKILLIDMDGVLVEPHGYHQAFRETVSILGRTLGYPQVDLSAADIAAFEAAGASSEWDSAAICAALLLEQRWMVDPDCHLPDDLAGPALSNLGLPAPDFQAFSRALASRPLQALRPLERAEALLIGNPHQRSQDQEQAIRMILRNARQIDGSLSHRIFQELILGSELFTQTYRLPPFLEVGSYLYQYDRPLLSWDEQARLVHWLAAPQHRAVLFTGRPSRAPEGAFSTPEAEQGGRLAGLEGIPIAGLGGLTWLGKRREREPQIFAKPSPVHALAALRLAAGEPVEAAFTSAASLALDRRADPAWISLQGAQVAVFEDTTGGLASVQAAQAILEGQGVGIAVSLYGIAGEAGKAYALQQQGARVFPSLPAALVQARILL